MTDQNAADQAASSPEVNRIDEAWDPRVLAQLPGVTVPRDLQDHLKSAPTPGIPAEVVRAVEPEVEPEPVKLPAPEVSVVREPAPEPASDGQFARAYRAAEAGQA